MFDEDKTFANSINNAIMQLNGAGIMIEGLTDGGNNSVIDDFDNKMVNMHVCIAWVNYVDKHINDMCDAVFDFIVRNSRGQGAFSNKGIVIGGYNPLVFNVNGNSNVIDIINLLNGIQRKKAIILKNVLASVYNRDCEVMSEWIDVVLNRKYSVGRIFGHGIVSRTVADAATCDGVEELQGDLNGEQ